MQTSKQKKESMHRSEQDIFKQANKKGCPRRTNVGLDLVSVVPLDWSMDDMCAIKQSSQKGLKISCTKTSVNRHMIVGRNKA